MPAEACIPRQASDTEAAFANLIQNVKTNPTWLLFVQHFKAGWKNSRKTGLLRAFLSVCQNRNISQTKNRVSLTFRNKACKESCRLTWWAAGERRLPGPTAPRQSHHMASPLSGTAATPTPAVSRPASFVEVAGPSSLSCDPKSYTSHLVFQLSSRKPETFETSAYAQALSLEALADPPLGFLGLTLVRTAKNVKALGFGNLRDRGSRFNEFKRLNLKAWAEGF